MRGCVRFLLIASAVVEPVTVAQAGDRAASRDPVVLASTARNPAQRAVKDERSSARTALDRVAYAVDGAESSHGEDRGMWGPDPSGPQGPMQVTEAAAAWGQPDYSRSCEIICTQDGTSPGSQQI